MERNGGEERNVEEREEKSRIKDESRGEEERRV